MAATLQVEDLLEMNNKALKQVFMNGHPIDSKQLENTQYRGIDLSLPKIATKILWKEFRKTFYMDPESGVLRGWNVRMEQVGWNKPGVTMKNKEGGSICFGHYHVVNQTRPDFPEEWNTRCYLDYGIAGNSFFDVARFTLAPLVAVNEGSSELLLGREVLKLGKSLFPLPDFWALNLEGELSDIAQPPK